MELTATSENPRLEEVRQQFEQWRHGRTKRGGIPDSLLQAAASLYPAYSIHCISKTLRLNHTRLKQYLQQATPDLPMTTADHFVEFDFSIHTSRCNVEMQHFAGSKMIIQGVNSGDLLKLARLFWKQP